MSNYNHTADWRVIGRVKEGTSIRAYVIENRAKAKKVVEKKVFEQLALNKKIYNCNAQEYKGEVNLRGVGKKLTELAVYTKNGKIVRGGINANR